MHGRTAALRLAFGTFVALVSAGRSVPAALEPQDVRSPSRITQTAPARTAQMQVCVRQVPDLSRYSAGSAGAILSKVELTLGSIQTQKSATPKGTIVGQSIKPGTQVRCGTRIDVYVSEGIPDVQQPPLTECAVPSLMNHSYLEVRERLRGWTIGRVEKVETRAAGEGTILKQSPAPRTMVKCNSSIDIAVAVAPPPPSDPLPPFDRPQGGPEHGRGAPTCQVPDLRGIDITLARRSLDDLVLGSVNRRPSERSPGTVIGQRPAPETKIACGSSIDVWIAVPLLIRVPAVQGHDLATARRTLEGVGLALGNAGKRESELPVGVVVDQHPLPETEVKPGTAVNVWLSDAPPLVQIPDLRGRDRASASDILNSQNLRLGEVSDRAVDATPGTIVDQQPRPGTMARRDTPVRVWVAASIEVPSVIGRREDDAAAILTNQRLRVGTIRTRESSDPAGRVIEQDPQPRRPARLNALVDLVLAIPITVVVPDLRGRNRQAATSALTTAELQLGETTTREVEGQAGLIVEQSPPAGERVELGTAVQVWVAVPIRVETPDLLGSTRDDSVNLLRARRLVLGSIESRTSVELPGRIVGQQPVAGTRVEVGTPVTIWIAAASLPDLIPPQLPPLLEPPGTAVNIGLAPPPVPPARAVEMSLPPATVPAGQTTPFVWLLLGAGMAAALAGITVKARARTSHEPQTLPPSLTLAPHPDSKMNVELTADGPLTRSELWLRPCPDAGTQTIQGSGPLAMIAITEMR